MSESVSSALVPAVQSYAEYIQQRSIVDSDSGTGKERNLAIFLLTPVGLSAPFYNERSVWASFLDKLPAVQEDIICRSSIVHSLYRLTCQFNTKLIRSMHGGTSAERSLAHMAFQKTVDQRGQTEFFHSIAQALLLDKLYWALSSNPDTDTDERPLQTPFVKKRPPPKQAERIHDLYLNWPTTLTEFAKNCDHSQPKEAQTTSVQEPSLSNIGGVINSLYEGTESSYANMKLSRIENNFCFAALGLVALNLHLSHKSSKGVDEPVKRLGVLLREHCPGVSEFICNLDDYNLLRPIYALACISPICLLSPLQVTKSGVSRVPLYNLIQMSTQPSLGPDPRRRAVEWKLLNVVLDMAVNGRSAFRRQMHDSIGFWQSKGILTDTLQCPNANIHALEWDTLWKHQQELKTADFRVATQLMMTVGADRRKQDPKAMEVIDLTGENPAWYNAAMGDDSDGGIVGESKDGKVSDLENECEETTGRGKQGEKPEECEEATGRGKRGKKPASRRDEADPQPLKSKSKRKRSKPSKSDYSNKPSAMESRPDNSRPSKRPKPDDSRHSKRPKSSEPVSVEDDSNMDVSEDVEPQPDDDFAPRDSGEEELISSSEDLADSPEDSEDSPEGSREEDEQPEKSPIATDLEVGVFGDPLAFDHKAKHAKPKYTQTISVYVPDPTPKSGVNMEIDTVHTEVPPNPTDRFPTSITSAETEGMYPEPLNVGKLGKLFITQFKTVNVDYSVWASVEQQLNAIRDYNMSQNDPKFKGHEAVVTIMRADWEKMERKDKRNLFSHSCIHISGPPRLPPCGVEGWESESLRGLVDFYEPRQCHDIAVPTKPNQSHQSFRQASLDELEEYRRNYAVEGEKMSMRCLNFLDIPLSGSLDIELDDMTKYAHLRSSEYVWKTSIEPTSLASRWMLAALKSAWSDWHADAAGLSTYIHIWEGSKVWFVNADQKMDTDPEIGWHPKEGQRIDAVYLQAGDDFYMQANVSHAVISTSDCITLGAHFYSNTQFSRVLYAITNEHYYGLIITNTEHTKSPILLMKAVAAYLRRARCGKLPFANDKDIGPVYDELAHLLILVRHLDQLSPELPENSREKAWQVSPEFKADFQHTLENITSLISLLPPQVKAYIIILENEYFSIIKNLNATLKGKKKRLLVKPKSLV